MLRILLLLTATAWAQSAGDVAANQAYDALRAKDYDRAIAQFAKAVAEAANRASLHKDFAYTLLKVGETTAAREQFAEAMRLDPTDDHVALEYAFLCYEETDLKQTARRVFDRLRAKNATAREAFENVDLTLRDGISRWRAAVLQAPENFSAHEELAKLAEQRDEFALAAEHYQAALKLRPSRRDLLLDLGRVWRDQGQAENSLAAFIAASRGNEPRIAETAKALLPARYPYVYELEQALGLDPTNEELRRELAYLHQEMGNRDAARREFDRLPERAPAPPVTPSPVLLNRADPAPDDKAMAARSLDKGYLPDAARYLRTAYESDPGDFETILKLGWTYNALKDDREAVRWFDLARRSPDEKISEQASRAYNNLASSLRRFHTSFWMFPMVSTRWQDTFVYSQAKAELRFASVPIRPYASIRFIGDMRGRVQPIAGLAPQYLSEQSAIVALGAATPSWQGATLWFEVGTALHYSGGGRELDVRGGLSFARRATRGHWFAETNDDALYVRRFNRDTLIYSQNRAGWTVSDAIQIYWNGNATVDTKREYWANTVEIGPGARWRVNGVEFSANFLRGAYLKNANNPYRPNYNDLRIGVWYALSH